MIITINGKQETIQGEVSLEQFLKSKNLDFDSIVVELNLNIIKKNEFSNIYLKENDTLEILRFVGGG